MLLKPPVAAVVEDPAVVERAVLGCRSAEAQARTVKHLGNEIGDQNMSCKSSPAPSAILRISSKNRSGTYFRCWETFSAITRLGSRILNPPTSMLASFALTSNRNQDVLADVVAEQGPLLITHFIGFPLDVEDPVSVDLLEEPLPASRDDPGLGVGGPERPVATIKIITRERIIVRGIGRSPPRFVAMTEV